jgi:hypothetical protein
MRKFLFVLLFALPGFAQTVVLMPEPRFQFVDATGTPLVNGCVFTYAAGTTTPQATYTDSTGGTPNANPVILDTLGSASIWFSSNLSYKLVLFSAGSPANATCSNGSELWSQDNVPGGLWSITNNSGDAFFSFTASESSYSSTGEIGAVVSNDNNGEFQFQIGTPTPYGWKFCTTYGGSSCPLKIAGGAPTGFLDVGSATNTLAVSGPSDTGVQVTTNNGTYSSVLALQAISSGSRNGDVRVNDSTPTPYGISLEFGSAGTIPFFLTGGAPTGAETINADGTVTFPEGIKTGTSSNTDQAGTCILGTSCVITFANTYSVAPICTASDTSNADAVKVVVTATTLTLTGNATDTLDYVCIPRH